MSKLKNMKLKNLFTETKDVQTNVLRKVEEGNVIALQIDKEKTLKEHVSKVPAILICVSGKAVYKEENRKVKLSKGKYVLIAPNVIHEVIAKKKSNFILVK